MSIDENTEPTHHPIERKAALQGLRNRDAKPHLAKNRAVDEFGQPEISVERSLVREVEIAERRLEAARQDLRRYRLSHDASEASTS